MGNSQPVEYKDSPIIRYNGIEISFNKIFQPTHEKINKFVDCLNLLARHRNKKFVFIDNILPYNNDDIYYDYTNLILYYNGQKFYNFELNELEKHLILMTVCDKYVNESIDDYLDTPNVEELFDFGMDQNVRVHVKSRLFNLNYAYIYNDIKVRSFYNIKNEITSSEQVLDFLNCYNALKINGIKYNLYNFSLDHKYRKDVCPHETGFEFLYRDIYTGLNLRQPMEIILSSLKDFNKSVNIYDSDDDE